MNFNRKPQKPAEDPDHPSSVEVVGADGIRSWVERASRGEVVVRAMEPLGGARYRLRLDWPLTREIEL